MKCPYCEKQIHAFCNGEVWTKEQWEKYQEEQTKIQEIKLRLWLHHLL